jgi:hypothetical protein
MILKAILTAIASVDNGMPTETILYYTRGYCNHLVKKEELLTQLIQLEQREIIYRNADRWVISDHLPEKPEDQKTQELIKRANLLH